MRILVVDLSSIARKFFELDKDGRLSDGNAFSASLNHITRARDGFDRLVIARDMRPSFRHFVCPTYKQGRENPGAVYTKLESDLVERLWKDGAKIFPNKTEAADPQFEIKPGGFPEADDIISSIAAWYTDNRSEEWELVIASEDSDLAALVDDETKISMRRLDGTIWNEADVLAKFKCKPSEICDLKTIGGDKGDGYQPFPHPSIEGGPGIGPTTALKLLATWGQYGGPELEASRVARVMLAAEDGHKYEQANPGKGPPPGSMPDSHERRCLLAGGRAAMTMAYECARMLDQLPLGFERILKEPEVRPIAEPSKTAAKVTMAPKDPEPVKHAMILTSGVGFDRLALQPTSLDPLLGLAEMFYNSRMFPHFKTIEEIATVIFEARERGIPAATALRNAYVVKGRPAWSAAAIAGMVKASSVCKLFRIKASTMTSAVVEYQRTDEPDGPFEFEFTIDEAKAAGWLKSGEKGDGKWITNPRTMLRWAAMREAARAFFQDVVSGCYTREELTGDVSNDDLKNEARVLDGVLEQ